MYFSLYSTDEIITGIGAVDHQISIGKRKAAWTAKSGQTRYRQFFFSLSERSFRKPTVCGFHSLFACLIVPRRFAHDRQINDEASDISHLIASLVRHAPKLQLRVWEGIWTIGDNFRRSFVKAPSIKEQCWQIQETAAVSKFGYLYATVAPFAN